MSNTDQADDDGDGIGEVCDNCPGVANVLLCCFVQDNCQYVSNTDQADDDGDGIAEVCDNCPGVANLL